MLVAGIGPMGSGKTLSCVYLIARDHYERGREVHSNIRLGFPHKPLDIEAFLDPERLDLGHAVTLIDEAPVFIDSRVSSSKMNRTIMQVVMQSRKRDCDVYVTAQSFGMLDKRFRQHCDYVLMPQMLNDNVLLKMYNTDSKTWTKVLFHAKPIFDLYDTNQIIAPIAAPEK